MATFKVGDVVQLKSGGPSMTVDEVDGDTVTVEWFDKQNAPQRRSYSAGALKAYTPPPAPSI